MDKTEQNQAWQQVNELIEKYQLHDKFVPFGYTQIWNQEFINNTKGLKFDFVLEIGCFEGLTTNYICDNLLNEGGRIICIDPLADYYLTEKISQSEEVENYESHKIFAGQYERFVKNTMGKPVQLIRKRSADAYVEIIDYRFGFVYIDGDHRFQQVLTDAKMAFNVCADNGLMLFDDYGGYHGEVKRALDKFMMGENSGRIEVVFSNYQLMLKKLPAK